VLQENELQTAPFSMILYVLKFCDDIEQHTEMKKQRDISLWIRKKGAIPYSAAELAPMLITLQCCAKQAAKHYTACSAHFPLP